MTWIAFQSSSPALGDFLNVFGIGILLIAGFHYVQYRESQDPDEQREARRNVTVVLLTFVFYDVVSYIYWGHTDSWVVQLGRSFDVYFEEMAQNLIISDGADETSGGMTILDGVRTIGLVAYVLLFGATAVVGKAPIKVFDALFK